MFRYGDYKIKFFHTLPDTADALGLPWSGTTTCTIIECWPNKIEVAVAQGEAHCSLKDQFSRTTGREIAFARALKVYVRKEERLAWWRAFWASDDGRGTDGACHDFWSSLAKLF